MIVREHYADSYPAGAGGDLLRLDYTASAIPEAATVAQFLASAGLLFTVTTPRGLVCAGLRKETIELEGGAGQITAKIRYAQRAEDQAQAGGAIAIAPAAPAGADLPVVSPGAVSLPLLSHHWRLRVTGAFLAPAAELRCTGTCLDDPTVKALIGDGLGGAAVAVPTPQFGILGGMVKTEVGFEPHDGPAGMLRVTLVWRSVAAGPEEFPLVEIRCTTGLTPGSCTLTKSLRGQAPTLSETLGQVIAFEGRFAGRVVNLDRYVASSGVHTASVTALDARWEMAGTIIGSAPAGVEGAASYALRGYEWVFNRHGQPDRAASGAQFDDGDDAAYWTFGDILSALSGAYLPSTVSAPAWASLANAGKTPGEIDLRGRDLASAIDSLLAQMGYTWTLRYAGSGASLFPFNAAAGTLSVPTGSISASSQAATYAKRADTIRDAYGQTEVLSGPALCQCGFASAGATAFAGAAPLAQQTLEDAEFAYAFQPDFSAINGLFPFVPNRAGAGYPLHPDLGSRLLDGAPGYAPARESGDAAAATPRLPATSYFWVSWNDLGGTWRRVTGGIELRLFPAEILVRRRITVYQANASQDAPATEEVRPLDRPGFMIAGTLAFVSDARSLAVAGSTTGLPIPRLRLATQRDIVPVYASSWIGDAFDSDDLNGYVVYGAATTLVSVDAQLADLAAAAQAGQVGQRVESEARLAYWPDAGAIGQELSLDGADFGGAAGIVTELILRRGSSESCVVRASNQPLSAAQGRMAPIAAARRHFLNQLSDPS